jgi:hypothetical protein
VRIDPTNADARVVLVACLIGSGDREQARAEFETLMALRPPNADELRRWFAGRMR